MSFRKLRLIHKPTGGSENGVHLAKLTVEHDLPIQDLSTKVLDLGHLGLLYRSSLISAVKSIKSAAGG